MRSPLDPVFHDHRAGVVGFDPAGAHAGLEIALRMKRLADPVDVALHHQEIEFVPRIEADLVAHLRFDRRIDVDEPDLADHRPHAAFRRLARDAAAERHLMPHAEAQLAAVARDGAQLDVTAREEADHEGRLAALAQVLRHRELDLLAQALADRQARGRVGATGADQRRVVVEVGIHVVAALDAEGIEADRAAGHTEQIRGQ